MRRDPDVIDLEGAMMDRVGFGLECVQNRGISAHGPAKVYLWDEPLLSLRPCQTGLRLNPVRGSGNY